MSSTFTGQVCPKKIAINEENNVSETENDTVTVECVIGGNDLVCSENNDIKVAETTDTKIHEESKSADISECNSEEHSIYGDAEDDEGKNSHKEENCAGERKQIIILSESGKPIYSRYEYILIAM